MGHLKTLLQAIKPNPFLSRLRRSHKHAQLLFFWNRGLGDIALELYPLFTLVKTYLPHASITIITRDDLYEGFCLLDPSYRILVSKQLKRKQIESYDDIFSELSLKADDFDHIFYKPDPAYWAKKIKKDLVCKLFWQERFYKPYPLNTIKPVALLHLHSETVYGFEKNLPKTTWDLVIDDLKQKGYYTIALGFTKDAGEFAVDLDLRCQTSLHVVISLMIQTEGLFIGPDSGLLNMFYYLDIQKPLHLISFWANPRVGLLKQKTLSPNLMLKNVCIMAPKEDLKNLSLKDFQQALSDVSQIKHLFLKHPLSLSQAVFLQDQIKQAQKELYSYSFYIDNTKTRDTENPTYQEVSTWSVDSRIMPIIIAGGQGTRLCFDKPKALFEIHGKPLIYYFIQKIKKASLASSQDLKAVLITSQEGFPVINDHLKANDYYGLKPEQLCLIAQQDHYFLTQQDQLVLKNSTQLHKGPNGNGDVFHLLKAHGFFETLDASILGLEIIPIDNPLAPLYSSLFASSFAQEQEAAFLAFQTKTSETKLGKLAQTKEGLRIIEYTENPADHLTIANTGILGFSIKSALSIANQPKPVLHCALKNYMCFTGRDYELIKVKKFEGFIFDHLHSIKNSQIYLAEKSRIFQPLKERSGPYGIEELEKSLALQGFDIC